MKTLIIAGCVALGVLTLLPGPVAAETTCNNQVGLFVHPDGLGPPRAVMDYMEPLRLYLVLIRPTSCEAGYAPLASINGFECSLRFDPAPAYDLFLVQTVYHPTPVLQVGRSNINEGVIDFRCAYAQDVPVTNDAVVLVELLFLPRGAVTTEVFLEPLPVPSIADEMSFCAGCPNGGMIMHPVSGSHELPVFVLQAGAVAAESMTFGSVKALYR